MPQRKGRPGRQKSSRNGKAAKASRTNESADAAAELSGTEAPAGISTGVEYPVPRLAWSLRPS